MWGTVGAQSEEKARPSTDAKTRTAEVARFRWVQHRKLANFLAQDKRIGRLIFKELDSEFARKIHRDRTEYSVFYENVELGNASLCAPTTRVIAECWFCNFLSPIEPRPAPHCGVRNPAARSVGNMGFHFCTRPPNRTSIPESPRDELLGSHRCRTGTHLAIGKTVDLSGRGYTVIGVMPADFDFPADAQVPGFDFLPVTGAFVVLCSIGLAPSIVPALGAMEAPLTKLLIK